MNAAPTAVLNATPISGKAPLQVDFTGDQSTDDVAVTDYSWDFDDGNSSNLANPSHTFANAGSYNVTLTVTDAEGLQDATTITIQVDETPMNTAPTAVLNATPISGNAPLQ
ncbi:PKD domain-containing protein, partial [Muricauda sp. 2012CJ35-5]